MKCPKDADKKGVVCGNRGNSPFCTRKPKHWGFHHAHYLTNKCLAVWQCMILSLKCEQLTTVLVVGVAITLKKLLGLMKTLLQQFVSSYLRFGWGGVE